MITIQNLDVRLEVVGDGDKQAFAKLFNECIRRWAADAQARQEREREAARERSLGDREADCGDLL